MKTSRVEARLLRALGRADREFGLIRPGDRVLVAVSGGKDSLGLLHLLGLHRARLPYGFAVDGLILDQGQPGFDATRLLAWAGERGHALRAVRQDSYRVIREKLGPDETPCPLCARLRRGRLYEEAARGGYDRLALGHHRDDAIETLLLNLFYAGRLGAMVPRLRSDDGRNVLIRPLWYCAEEDLRALAEEQGFPLLPCGLCEAREDPRRRAMKTLLARLQAENPKVKGNALAALSNADAAHLADDALRDALGLERLGVSPGACGPRARRRP